MEGPVLQELAELSFDAGEALADALCHRLSAAADSRSSVPVLKCLRHVTREGSREFRKRLRDLDEHLRARSEGEAGKIAEVRRIVINLKSVYRNHCDV